MYCTQDDLLKMIPAGDLAHLTAESGDQPDADVVESVVKLHGGTLAGYKGSGLG